MFNLLKITHQHRFEIVALFFTISGFYYRIKELAKRDLWVDEINQLKHTIGAFKPIWQQLPNGELTAFPGDYILKWPFVHFFGPENKWLINAPHYIITLIGFWLFYKISKRYISSIWAFIAGFIFMTYNQSLVYHAFEFRPYAVLPTIALTCFYIIDLLISEPKKFNTLQKWLIGALFFYITIYHAYGLMIIMACGSFFTLKALLNKKSFSTLLKEQYSFWASFLLCAIPAYVYYATGVPWFNQTHTSARHIEIFAYIPDFRTEPNTFFRTVLGHLRGFKMYKTKLLQYAILLSIFIPNKQKWLQFSFLVLLIIFPIGAILASDMIKGYWFIQRQFVWAMPLFAFLIGWCLDSVIIYGKSQPWKKKQQPIATQK